MRRDADSGGYKGNESSEWILRCQGWHVDDPDGYVGVVIEVLYDYSARWDVPSALRVRTEKGHSVSVPVDAIARVDASTATVVLRERA